jgi:phytanoyl-CoA hydroxylase
MHVTPRGTPVYQQDVFFNPKKNVSDKSRWKYGKFGGRSYVHADKIDIGHREVRRVSEFIR